MNRIDRLNALMIHLQSKPRVTLDELESRFELSRRTLFRDIRSLLEAGVPIGGDAGEGYFIVEGYHLPPVVFNKQEASALLTGSKLVEQQTDKELATHYQSAMTKIKAVLRSGDKEFVDRLESSISVTIRPNEFEGSNLAEIQYAIVSQRVIKMDYFSNSGGEMTTRAIEPLGLVFYSGKWHLIAYCRMRKGMRDFRTDRIERIALHKDTFDPAMHPDYMDFVNESTRGTDAKKAIIQFSPKIARYIAEQRHFFGFASEEIKDEHVIMTFYSPYFEPMARWLLSFGIEAHIIEPIELKDIAKLLVEQLKSQYL